MGDRQIGLAGTRRADAEHQFGPVHGAHIGVLRRGAGDDCGFARGDLGHAHPALLFERREGELAVLGLDHADHGIDVGNVDGAALFEQRVERFQHAARLIDTRSRALQHDVIAARRGGDRQALLDQRKMLIEVAVELGSEAGCLQRRVQAGRKGRCRWWGTNACSNLGSTPKSGSAGQATAASDSTTLADLGSPCVTILPWIELFPAAMISTGCTVPIRRSGASRCTACR